MNFKNMGMDGRDGQQPPAQLARQSSVYSLTFDEFQNTMGSLGKDFGSMNMDELLRNIWTAEESQAMAMALGAGPGPAGTSSAAVGLQRQGSLTLPRTLSQKTVDEVWKDLIGAGQGLGSGAGDALPQQRQPTLGEMTLEEFLVRAGVVREDMTPPQVVMPPRPAPGNGVSGGGGNMFFGDMTSSGIGYPPVGKSSPTMVNSHAINHSPTNLGMKAGGVRPFGAPMGLVNGVDIGNAQGIRGGMVGIGNPGMNNSLMQGMVGLGATAVPVATVSPMSHLQPDGLGKATGDLSSVSPVPYVFNNGLRGRKRTAVEKVVERRQRRMIKNRESAARSRARKQAYTMELEAEVAQLKEQNQELQKKQAEMMETQKTQVLELLNQQRGPKKQSLQRTLTGPW